MSGAPEPGAVPGQVGADQPVVALRHHRRHAELQSIFNAALATKVGREVPWARSLGVSLHWIRYSTLTDIRMTSGERVAAAYAGHGDGSGGITALYTRASFAELQEAHRVFFGQPARTDRPGVSPSVST